MNFKGINPHEAELVLMEEEVTDDDGTHLVCFMVWRQGKKAALVDGVSWDATTGRLYGTVTST